MFNKQISLVVLMVVVFQSCYEESNTDKIHVKSDPTWFQAFEDYQVEGDSVKKHLLLFRSLKYAKNADDSVTTYINLVNSAERFDSTLAALKYIEMWNKLDRDIETNFMCYYSKFRVFYKMNEFDSSLYYLNRADSIQKSFNVFLMEDSVLEKNKNMLKEKMNNSIPISHLPHFR